MIKKAQYGKTSNLVALSAADLIMPYFVIEGARKSKPVTAMPGVARLSIDNLLKDIAGALKLGIRAVLIFGVCPSRYKDSEGSYAFSKGSIVVHAVAEIKKRFKNISIITDVCLCSYTSHGHCGIIKSQAASYKLQAKTKSLQPGACSLKQEIIIDNKATLKILSKIALMHAEAGADWVAPSACAPGQVRTIRRVLNTHGFKKTKILGYSAKFASNFYGPFRNAAGSSPAFGDRQSYQLNFSDAKRALAEIKYDIDEGADMVMVKPALSYLDIIKEAHLKFNKPLAAYNVSGEYSLVKYGADKGLWDEKKMVMEIITSIKRAGAGFIISYHAKDIARWLAKD